MIDKGYLVDLGIQGFFVFTKQGLPLVERIYDSSLQSNQNSDSDDKAMMLGGFFSAMTSFAREEFSGLLSDIGFHTSRLYIDFTTDLFLVLVFSEERLQNLPVKFVHILLKGTLSAIKSMFLTFLSSQDINLLFDPKRVSNLRISLIKMHDDLDKLIIDSYKDAVSMFRQPTLLTQILESKIFQLPDLEIRKLIHEDLKKQIQGLLKETIDEIFSGFKPKKPIE